MDEAEILFADGDWVCRVNDDGTCTIVKWNGRFTSEGAIITVPDSINGYPVRDIEGDPINAESVSGLVDDGWYPSASIESSPGSPARLWAAKHCSDYLFWNATEETEKATVCKSTILDDDTVRIDSWWSAEKELDVPGDIDCFPVSAIGDGAFSFCEIRQLSIPEGVTEIGEDAFRRCHKLWRVTLPNTVTRLGGGAFADCSRLSMLKLSSGIRAIEPFTFAYCHDLEKIEVPEGVRELKQFAFANTWPKQITLPSTIEHIDDAALIEIGDCEVITPEDSYARRWCEEHRELIGVSFSDFVELTRKD